MKYHDEDFRFLVKRFAKGREICNCGQAYYTNDRGCAHGCSSNQMRAKEEIASCIVYEFGLDIQRPASSIIPVGKI